MPNIYIGKPNPKQDLFLRAKKKYIGFGGARGGGKSWSVRAKAKLLALHYAGIRILIVRRTYPELVNNHINQLRSDLIGVAKYNDKDKVLKFRNGSSISFMYCQYDKDLDHLQGVEYDIIFLDEATQLSEYQMKIITACMRGANSFPKRCYYTCNPGGQGHQYIKRIFIDKHYEKDENPDDYEFIQSLVTDNHVLMELQPDYVRQLENMPPKIRDAWLYGSWDVYQGQYFETFADRPEHYDDHQWTHVINPFEIPKDWNIARSFDWGYNRPFSTGYWAISPDGVIYRILEFYGCTGVPNEGLKWEPNKVFAEMRKFEESHDWLKGRHIIGVADPAIWNAEYGESVAETAAAHSIFFTKGDHERLAGWLQMQYRLSFDDNGYAMMYIFSNCKAFIRTIPLLMYDEHKVEDIDTDGEDHVADETRYFCMSRPIAPRLSVPYDKYKESETYLYLNIPKEDILPKPKRARMEVKEIGE